MWLRPIGSSRWLVGVAWYGGDMLLWYRGLSLAVPPHARLCPPELRGAPRRTPGRHVPPLPPAVVVLAIAPPEGTRELAMDPSPVTGFLSWGESAPPVS